MDRILYPTDLTDKQWQLIEPLLPRVKPAGQPRHTNMREVVHGANIQDRDGAMLVLEKLRGLFPRSSLIWADGGYSGKLIDWCASVGQWVLQIVKRCDDVVGFTVLPRRWIVERTFAWPGKYRRLSKDCESLTPSSETMIDLAMINLASSAYTGII